MLPTARRPAGDLVARYCAVLAGAWRHRHDLAGPRRLAAEAAFLPAALSLQETPLHPAPRRTAWVIMGLFVCAVAWTTLGEVDVVAIAPGRIVVSDRTKLVQPLERSVVKRVLVRNGDRVATGQPLVELDPTAALADRVAIEEQLRAAIGDGLRARGLIRALSNPERVLPGAGARTDDVAVEFPDSMSAIDRDNVLAQLRAESRDIGAKLARHAAEIARRQAEIGTVLEMVAKLESTIPLMRQREDDFRKLSDQGFVAVHAGQDRTRDRIEQERDLATQQARLVEARASLSESHNARAAYLAEVRRMLQDREAQASLRQGQAIQEQAKAERRERLTTLVSPVAGTVQQLAANTEGGVVTEAQTLMVVVPEAAEVFAEVSLDNKDIGFVQVGDRAEIKLETFPYTRHGTIGARVITVSADAVVDEKRGAFFAATLALESTSLKVDQRMVRLSPGMNLTAEVATGRRKISEYLLSPLHRGVTEGLKER